MVESAAILCRVKKHRVLGKCSPCGGYNRNHIWIKSQPFGNISCFAWGVIPRIVCIVIRVLWRHLRNELHSHLMHFRLVVEYVVLRYLLFSLPFPCFLRFTSYESWLLQLLQPPPIVFFRSGVQALSVRSQVKHTWK